MRRLGFVMCLLAGLALAPMPAAKSQGIIIGPGGVQVVPPGAEPAPRQRPGDPTIQREISRSEAIRIARRLGVIDVDTVFRDGRNWVVEGVDRRGRDREVVIHRRTGEVVSFN